MILDKKTMGGMLIGGILEETERYLRIELKMPKRSKG